VTAAVVDTPTAPIAGMRPGTSGLRKKVEAWMGPRYVENFAQSLLDTAVEFNGGRMLDTLVVAGDGRYFNGAAIATIARLLAANGVRDIWIPRGGIMSTPAVSAVIRRRTAAGPGRDGEGAAQGGIILTASHNPGGPGADFGIKYNEGLGQPAGDAFTDALYAKTQSISSYKSLAGAPPLDLDLAAPVGTTYPLTATSTVTLIDPFQNYLEALEACFDFPQLRAVGARADFSLVFDGMHGAGGPFARRILVEALGLPAASLLRCDPRPDFGGCHPDPNLTYAAALVARMGLAPDGGADPAADAAALPTLGAANDGDGDRNLVAGAGCFVTPSDSLVRAPRPGAPPRRAPRLTAARGARTARTGGDLRPLGLHPAVRGAGGPEGRGALHAVLGGAGRGGGGARHPLLRHPDGLEVLRQPHVVQGVL
jgi:phosphoglucomutase